MSPWLRWTLASLLPLASLHCGAGAAPTPGPSDPAVDSGTNGDETRGPTPPDPVPPDPNPPGGATMPAAPRGVLLIHAHATLPAVRICPASTSATPAAPSSFGSGSPIPTLAMPRSSLAGLDVQGAALLEKDPEYAQVKDVVLILLNEATKGNPSLATGSCAALACVGSAPCVGAANMRLVSLPNEGFLDKDGAVLVLTGASDAEVRFLSRRLLGAPPSEARRLSVQLVNESAYDGGVSLHEGDAGVSAAVSSAPSTVAYSDFGASFVAGKHQETLLQVFDNTALSGSPTEFYEGSPHALVLVGSEAPQAARPLKFLAIPLRL